MRPSSTSHSSWQARFFCPAAKEVVNADVFVGPREYCTTRKATPVLKFPFVVFFFFHCLSVRCASAFARYRHRRRSPSLPADVSVPESRRRRRRRPAVSKPKWRCRSCFSERIPPSRPAAKPCSVHRENNARTLTVDAVRLHERNDRRVFRPSVTDQTYRAAAVLFRRVHRSIT